MLVKIERLSNNINDCEIDQSINIRVLGDSDDLNSHFIIEFAIVHVNQYNYYELCKFTTLW